MSDNDLYQEVILDHYKNPRNRFEMEDCTHCANGDNPLCGDKLKVYLKVNNTKVIEKLSFTGTGCAISQASASLMAENLIGKNLDDAFEIFDSVHAMFTGKGGDFDMDLDFDFDDKLGKLAVLSGVSDYPMRVKCASLAWHTMKIAVTSGDSSTVSTEM